MTKVTTKSGSVYLLNKQTMTFSRTNHNADANVRMLDEPEIEGKLANWPVIEVGRPLYLFVSLTKPEVGIRDTWLRSTAVATIEEDAVVAAEETA